jgi:hypothetical protein
MRRFKLIEGAQVAEPPAEVTPENLEAVMEAHGHGRPDYGLLPHVAALRDELEDDVIDPLVKGNSGFDFETVFTNLDGEADEPHRNAMADDDIRQAASKMSARMLSLILDWLLNVNLQQHGALKSIGVRTVTMAWVIDPKRFEGASLTGLAKSLGYGSAMAISPEAAEFSRRFGITNKFQAHAPNKEKNYATPPATN